MYNTPNLNKVGLFNPVVSMGLSRRRFRKVAIAGSADCSESNCEGFGDCEDCGDDCATDCACNPDPDDC